jgi:hypothetical protein
MGADTPVRLSERLQEEGARVEAFFRDFPPEKFDDQIYTDGTCWCVRDILAHLSLAEDSMRRLIGNILQGGTGTPEDFDLNAYNERKVAPLKGTHIDGLLDQFHQNRQKTIELVNEMDAADMEKQGRHPFLGITTLAEIIKMIYRHNQIHIREIRHSMNASAGQAQEQG